MSREPSLFWPILALGTSSFAQGSLPGLASRSSSGRSAARAATRTISAKVGRVSLKEAKIRTSRDSSSAVLFRVPQGTNLAILTEKGEHFGVLMVNDTLGWVPKSALEIVEGFETKVTLKAASTPASIPTSGDGTDGAIDFSQASPSIQKMLQHAFGWSGTRYVYGGESRRGIDCSAFVRDCYRQLGVELPRVAADQSQVGQAVDWSDLKPGDRLYFDMKREGRIGHCGLYIGNGYFIHASSNQGKVGVDSLFKSNYYRGLVGARRG